MRFLRRSLIGLFLVCTTLALLAGAGLKITSATKARMAAESMPAQARERQFAVNVVEIVPETVTPVLTSYGQLQARQSLELRAPDAGRIIALNPNFEEGGAVRAGDVILQIDTADAEAAVRVAEADLLEAQADLRDAERASDIASDDLAQARAQLALRQTALQRQESLVERGFGSVSAVEDAQLAEAAAAQSVLSKRQSLADQESAVENARTAVLRAEINLDETRRTLEDMTVTAAFDGVLSEVSGALGTLLSTNEQFATLIAPGDLEAAFRISTEQYARLVTENDRLPEMEVSVSLNVAGLDLVTRGVVVRESAAVAEGQSGRTLYAKLDKASGFRPGDFVTVQLEEPELQQVALVPATAVAGNNTVLAVTDQSRLEEIAVRVLRRQGDDVIIAAQGVSGRQVVSERTPLLGAGIRVKVNNGPDSAASSGAPDVVTLTDERREQLLAFVRGNSQMGEDSRNRIIEQLSAEQVPADLVARLEQRMGS
ncbi:efflux RND transporter periplasmic adaptor subunit [Celeribacter litoreus]|uniref:efflux RND transporter periplasmic adaptor subunit n=1 Tax=Celeribacter litoreus TaxID=2876714 RepID=UPI001CCF8094|nr:efflux transporter periplasmic adaptor subunit [Celeribacter litoreus]MCA0044308.1 efflux transporter periplasmic adaptor subunit [Celeribacter litoreus]